MIHDEGHAIFSERGMDPTPALVQHCIVNRSTVSLHDVRDTTKGCDTRMVSHHEKFDATGVGASHRPPCLKL